MSDDKPFGGVVGVYEGGAEASGHGLGMPDPVDSLELLPGEPDRHEVLESFAEILDHRNTASEDLVNGVFVMGRWQDRGPVAEMGDSCIEVVYLGFQYKLKLVAVAKEES